MIIALASPRVAVSLDDGLDRIKRLLAEASAQEAELACFPEAYLPGLRGVDFEVLPFGDAHPVLAAYLGRLRARPSFARVLDEMRPVWRMFPLASRDAP